MNLWMRRKTLKNIRRSGSILQHRKKVVQLIPSGTCFTEWRISSRSPSNSSHWQKHWCCATYHWKHNRATYVDIQAMFGSGRSQVGTILHDHLGVIKLCTRWVPPQLEGIAKEGTCRTEWANDKTKAKVVGIMLSMSTQVTKRGFIIRSLKANDCWPSGFFQVKWSLQKWSEDEALVV